HTCDEPGGSSRSMRSNRGARRRQAALDERRQDVRRLAELLFERRQTVGGAGQVCLPAHRFQTFGPGVAGRVRCSAARGLPLPRPGPITEPIAPVGHGTDETPRAPRKATPIPRAPWRRPLPSAPRANSWQPSGAPTTAFGSTAQPRRQRETVCLLTSEAT